MDSVFEILTRIFGRFFITYLDTLIETLFDKQSTKKEKNCRCNPPLHPFRRHYCFDRLGHNHPYR